MRVPHSRRSLAASRAGKHETGMPLFAPQSPLQCCVTAAHSRASLSYAKLMFPVNQPQDSGFPPAGPMPVLRSAFIALSRNRPLRHFCEHSHIGSQLSSRFVAGLEIEDALRVAEAVNNQGMLVSLDSLGESVGTEAEAHAQPISTTACSTPLPAASSTPTLASSSPRWASRSTRN